MAWPFRQAFGSPPYRELLEDSPLASCSCLNLRAQTPGQPAVGGFIQACPLVLLDFNLSCEVKFMVLLELLMLCCHMLKRFL
jgi:hypothetical protein